MPVPRRRGSNRAAAAPALAREVYERRLALGLTQQEVADLAGLARSSLQALESGRASTRLASLLAVADVLGCAIALVPLSDTTSEATS
ncbi:helix-turn-helix transcriptional regulator [Jiangella anatolica]|uniref:Transcriptional regulator n=1 Tax=Jiangella anatolica TaxID=2670374 RepID=A0A2W2BUN4_9ACTN|nr:helix-turn-helix transcriptional regulator [Jiangella anatolica]PZF84104.1 transcriptional regulator [Jiangella anatolica]